MVGLPNLQRANFGASDSTSPTVRSVFFIHLMKPDAHMAEIDPASDLESVLVQYADEIRRTRYGSFRGVIRDGRVVVFAIEQEWRPHLEEERRAARHHNGEGKAPPSG